MGHRHAWRVSKDSGGEGERRERLLIMANIVSDSLWDLGRVAVAFYGPNVIRNPQQFPTH